MKSRKTIGITAVLGLGLFTCLLAGSARAQDDSGEVTKCRRLKGVAIGLFDPATNTTNGTIVEGGRLNGTTVDAFGPGFAATQDPNEITFTSEFTLTTAHGQLKASNNFLFDFAGVAAILGRIDPARSTGIFAGATGFIYNDGKVTSFVPFAVRGDVTADICFAKLEQP